jgi:hypothetical protein
MLLLPLGQSPVVMAEDFFDSFKSMKETEPNDDFELANQLPLETVVSGTFSDEDVDVYRITVTKKGKLAILSREQSDSVLFFDLYNVSEEAVSALQCAQSDDNTKKACVYDVTPGTYYIGATDKENLATGKPYILLAGMAADLFLDSVEDYTDGYWENYVVFEADTTPAEPVVNPVGDNDRVVTGMAEPGTVVILKINDKVIDGETPVGKDGSFSIKITPQVAGTIIGVSAAEVPADGEMGFMSYYTETIVLDKTPPKSLNVNQITTKTKVVTGKTEAKALVEIKFGSKVIGKATADNKGNFKITIKNQKKGNKLTITASDKAKNKKTITVIVK